MCDISMLGDIKRAMQWIQHVTPAKAEHSPHPWQRPTINLDATIRSTASDMLLAVESDASYLSIVEARSRALPGYFYLTSKPAKPTNDTLKPNGAIHMLCRIMGEGFSSAA
jgi:hypothetical protein